MKKMKEYLIVALFVSIASQLYINLFVDGFIIAFSALLFPVFLYRYPNLNPIKAAVITGFFSPTFRALILWVTQGHFILSVMKALPDISFYISYGVIYYLIYYRKSKFDPTQFFFTILCCDFFSNIIELSIRTSFKGLDPIILKSLFAISFFRVIVVQMIILSMKSYSSLLMREEHENKYKKLMLTTSMFKSEIYLMNKNIVDIEDIMKKAFKLYRFMEHMPIESEYKKLSLEISTGIHEIKKDYLRVIQGLQDNFVDEYISNGMNIKDIVNILEFDIRERIKFSNCNIVFSNKIHTDFYVDNHFCLISILRNLLLNSLESLIKQKEGMINLNVYKDASFYNFEVRDNGCGIPNANLSYIFKPGFSTKFNYATGDINRGLGLTLVNELVKNNFDGEIDIDSKENMYTVFTVKVPIHKFFGES